MSPYGLVHGDLGGIFSNMLVRVPGPYMAHILYLYTLNVLLCRLDSQRCMSRSSGNTVI